MNNPLRRKRKQVWNLTEVKQGSGEFLLASMEPKEFDRVMNRDETMVLTLSGEEFSFLQTPICPIVVFRGKISEKLFK